jgi:hypothetical protein
MLLDDILYYFNSGYYFLIISISRSLYWLNKIGHRIGCYCKNRANIQKDVRNNKFEQGK